jgi:hypothetical protein
MPCLHYALGRIESQNGKVCKSGHAFASEANMSHFFGYFTSAYGTFWLMGHVSLALTHSTVNMGEFGYCGFPIIALIYALIRVFFSENQTKTIIQLRHHINYLADKLRESEEKYLRLERLSAESPRSASTEIEPI